MPEATVLNFMVEFLVGMDSGQALVRLSAENGFSVVMTADNARDLALNLLNAAGCAESDRSIFNYMTEQLASPVDVAGLFIHGVRQERAKDLGHA
jgi:hypothetical protein